MVLQEFYLKLHIYNSINFPKDHKQYIWSNGLNLRTNNWRIFTIPSLLNVKTESGSTSKGDYSVSMLPYSQLIPLQFDRLSMFEQTNNLWTERGCHFKGTFTAIFRQDIANSIKKAFTSETRDMIQLGVNGIDNNLLLTKVMPHNNDIAILQSYCINYATNEIQLI